MTGANKAALNISRFKPRLMFGLGFCRARLRNPQVLIDLGQASTESGTSGAVKVRPLRDAPPCKPRPTRARSRAASPNLKSAAEEGRPTLIASHLYLAEVGMEALGDLFHEDRVGWILGEFLDLEDPQLTSEIYNLLRQPGVAACFFDFWLAPATHPANAGRSAAQICKRSFTLVTLLSLPQAFAENLLEENVHPILVGQISRLMLAPAKPYVAAPVQPADVGLNFHHIKLGLQVLLRRWPTAVRGWLLTTRHARDGRLRPPVFGLLKHLHHPAVLPLLGHLLFDRVGVYADHAAALEAVAAHHLVETIWEGIWAEGKASWADLVLFLLGEGGAMPEAKGLFGYLGTSQYSEDLVDAFKLGSPARCQVLVAFIDGLRRRPFIPPNQPRGREWSLAQITYATVQQNLDCVCTAFTRLGAGFNASKVSFYGVLVESIRRPTLDSALGELGCNFNPAVFSVGFEWLMWRGTCSILQCMFLTSVDALVGCLAKQPHPTSAIGGARYVILELKAASRIKRRWESGVALSDELRLTLYLCRLALHALYQSLRIRSDSVDRWVGELRVEVEASADFELIGSPPTREPPLAFDTLPDYLCFTRSVLSLSLGDHV
ncbi:hypothetical protein L0F63_000360 [Massospora cicadina]|nr:hypothetical protein L0F63_000360 [Massospora cicadina]